MVPIHTVNDLSEDDNSTQTTKSISLDQKQGKQRSENQVKWPNIDYETGIEFSSFNMCMCVRVCRIYIYIYIYIKWSVCLSVCLSVYLSLCLPSYPIYLSIYLSISLHIHPDGCLYCFSVRLSVCPLSTNHPPPCLSRKFTKPSKVYGHCHSTYVTKSVITNISFHLSIFLSANKRHTSTPLLLPLSDR